MSFWIAVVLLSAISLFLLATPLWRKSKEEADRADYALSVFKDQLKELDKDLERGLISAEEAETARIEIQRRLLGADEKRRSHENAGKGASTKAVVLSSIVGIAVLAGTLALYFKIGMPGYQDVPYASRNIEKEHQVANNDEGMASEIAALKKRLEQEPKDIDAWILLGRTLRTVGRNEEAMEAFRNAVKESDRHPSVLADYAEAKIYADEGQVGKETLGALMEALQQDPMQMKARFYLGYAKARVEDFKGAIQTWTDLKAIAPPQAPWLKQVDEQIKMAAQAGDLDPADFQPSGQAKVMSKQLKLEWETEKSHNHDEEEAAPNGPSRAAMAAAQEMTPEEQAEMIRGMVERLADRLKENPDDLEGWKRLAQAYMVLGEKDKAIEARNKIKELGGS